MYTHTTMFPESNTTTLTPAYNISTTPPIKTIFQFTGGRLFFSVTLYCIVMAIIVFVAIYVYGQKNTLLHKPGKRITLKTITSEDNDIEIEMNEMLPAPLTCGVIEDVDRSEAPGSCINTNIEKNGVEYMSPMEDTDESDYTS